MYVCIYIFSDLLRKRDSLLRDFSLKKGSIPGYKGAWKRFQELILQGDVRNRGLFSGASGGSEYVSHKFGYPSKIVFGD